MSFLNQRNQFTKGLFKYESLEDVLDEDPEYLQYLLDNCELAPSEAAAIQEALDTGMVE
jgi:hypothetical protein